MIYLLCRDAPKCHAAIITVYASNTQGCTNMKILAKTDKSLYLKSQ